jgi:hypothetical protein
MVRHSLTGDEAMTHSCIATGIEDCDAAFGCQWLGAGDDAFGAVHDASSAAELGVYRPRPWEEVFRCERHLEKLPTVG